MHTRNFVIIAHIDHGKSTLADRFLELTRTVESRTMRPQYLDQMELERERGITIKMQPVRMLWPVLDRTYVLNLIDTPGHADFAYEVSRALAAVEGAVLLVDATQGVQAQTVSNLGLARAEGLAIIPVVNKIDAPGARVSETEAELAETLGCSRDTILKVSAKTGKGVVELLHAIVERVPQPRALPAPLGKPIARALIFDSQFDPYRGVIAHVRVFDGEFKSGERVAMAATGAAAELVDVGYFSPFPVPAPVLGPGAIGYLATGLKEPDTIRVGDSVVAGSMTDAKAAALPGYREPKPVVFASVYPEDADSYPKLADALKKMRLSDAAISFEPESSDALGRGWRMGFLGMLHMEIVQERLKREYGLAAVLTAPSVAYRVQRADGRGEFIYAASRMPDRHEVAVIEEPWVRLEVITPRVTLGAVLGLMGATRGSIAGQTYLGTERLTVTAEVPLADILVNFSDSLKSVTAGYGSFSYEPIGYRPGDLVRLDLVVAEELEPSLAQVVPVARAYAVGRTAAEKLKQLLPKQLFPIAIQAAVGGRVLARETIPALKKDVTGYLYGGDRTRKMKLWKKQQRGKKRLAAGGRVEIPPAVFLEMLRQ